MFPPLLHLVLLFGLLLCFPPGKLPLLLLALEKGLNVREQPLDHGARHGKNRAFESWGYSASDSTWLKNQSEKQALEKYLSGDYMLGKLDRRG